VTVENADSGSGFHKSLIDYYLACISRSARPEASFFAESKWGTDYAELSVNPFLGPCSVESGNEIARIFSLKGKKDKELYVGHLVFADFVQSSKTNWQGYILYPLFISPYDGDRSSIDATTNPIFVNPEAYKKLSGISSASELQDELLEFEERVGLSSENGSQISFDEVLIRVKEQFSFWPWVEQIPETFFDDDGKVLTELRDESLIQIAASGLYSRSLLFVADRPKFTLGLERELKDLSLLKVTDLKNTALGYWVDENEIENPFLAKHEALPLLEPMPLNSEQRDAVSKSMGQALTVITGPPGTGKSQVVSSILINSAFRGESVLFSSKNNKAVDVVEQRVNAIGKRPLLLRLGARDLQDRLSDYLTRIMAKESSPSDLAEFINLKQNYNQLNTSYESLNSEIDNLIEKRNRIDALDIQLDVLRRELNLSNFIELDKSWSRSLIEQGEELTTLYNRVFEYKSFINKFFPNYKKSKRAEALNTLTTSILETLREFSSIPSPNIESKAEVAVFRDRILNITSALKQLDLYASYLDELNQAENIGDLSKKLNQLQVETSKQSVGLWQSWLKTLPDRLDDSSKKILVSFKTSVGLLSRTSDGKSASALKAEQQKMFSSVLNFLPAWAVTSLSVRGRVPFSPAMFDLVVIDEASQCDIASALPLLYRAKRAVIIGDPLQLRHVASIDGSTDRMLLDQHGLMNKLEWSYSAQSLFDLATTVRSENSTIVLRDHHRSDAEIIGYSNSAFYEGQLRVATKHDSLRRPKDMATAVRWIEKQGTGYRPANGSVLCREEGIAVVEEIERLANQGYEGTIGVVTPFAPQAKYISDLVKQKDNLKQFLINSEFHVSTAHGFQGDERDLIIMSLALQPGTPDSAIKFVSSQSNLFNVAITRARAALVVVGDKGTKEIGKVPFIADFITYLDSLGQNKKINNTDFDADFGPKFPFDRRDNSVSDYEVMFYEALYARGIKTIPQWNEDQYRLDLALFKNGKKLDIEVDGESYHRQWTGENVRRDLLRNQRLIELGWDVQRFWVYQIVESLDACVDRVAKWANDQ
jgi:very-short-patch-repair endonuclease/arginyl-tRNA--protein-N-Asp/Glu arginylyltransferase